jgi:hypothetical protein
MQEPKRQKVWFVDHLAEHGWAVVVNVLSAEEVSSYVSRFWDWLESFGTLKRNDDITWMDAKNWPPGPRGMIQNFGIGHAEFVWALRTHPAVLAVFAELWGTDDLLVSFDGACAAPPYLATQNTNKSWAHIDQDERKAGQYLCVQGLVTLQYAGYDKGHLLHAELFKKFAIERKTKDWVKLTEAQQEWYFSKGCREIYVNAPPGSILLWDSRTPHWAKRPISTALQPRLAVYLCYTRRDKATVRELKRKQKAFTERRMTTHWPSEATLFPKKAWPNFRPDVFTDRPTITNPSAAVLRLAGFE